MVAIRDTAGRFRKYATVYITKELESMAKKMDTDLKQAIKDKLVETYKDQLMASYSPRRKRFV